MYAASSDFHDAVRNNNEQMPLLIFPDAVFTASDVDIDNGITFNDYFNLEEDLSIGQALSNELRFSIFNDYGYLDDYEFGTFIALLGVMIAKASYTRTGTISVTCGNNTYVAYSSSPYLKRNGTALSTQPTGPLANIIIYDGYVYAFQKDGGYKVYKDSDGSTASVTLGTFMTNKFKKETMYGAYLDKDENILTINHGTYQYTYEFVPLGTFIADRPNVPTVHAIEFSCNDQMMKFEKDMPDDTTLGLTYPTTISNLFVKMCEYLGVQYRTSTFINSTATISARPEAFDTSTMRDVLKWIAEAAASNARFDREGYLIFDWIRSTEQSYGPTEYKTLNPYWYETTTVTKLENRSSDGSYDNTSGSGDETYLIQDNPLLRGVE